MEKVTLRINQSRYFLSKKPTKALLGFEWGRSDSKKGWILASSSKLKVVFNFETHHMAAEVTPLTEQTPVMSGVHAFVSNCAGLLMTWLSSTNGEKLQPWNFIGYPNSSHYFSLSLTSQKTVLQPQFLEGWFACSPRWSDFKIYLFVSPRNNTTSFSLSPELTVVRGTQSCGTTERSEANITALNSLRLMTPCGTGRRWIEDCQWGIQGSHSCASLSWSKLLLKSNILLPF